MLFRTRTNRTDLDATKTPTAIDIAWSAGIFEGEGTVRLCGKTKRGFMLCIPQKDPELLYRLREMFGGSVNGPTGTKNACYRLDVCGDRARLFIAQIFKFLTSRRKLQVEAAKGLDFLRGESPENLSVDELKSRMIAFYEEHRNTTWNGANKSVIRRKRYEARKTEDPNYLATLNEKNKKWREKNSKGSVIQIA